jgi:serine phosphatase RsbU (regulator of sigma subunit)
MYAVRSFWDIMTSIGVRRYMSPALQRSLQASNIIAWTGMPVCFVVTLLIYLVYFQEPIVIVLGLISIVAIAVMPIFNYKGRHSSGILVFYCLMVPTVVVGSYAVRENLGFEYIFFFLAIVSFLFSVSGVQNFFLLLLSAAGLCCCIAIYYTHDNTLSHARSFIHEIMGLTILAFSVLALSLLTSRHRSYEQDIEKKNAELLLQKKEMVDQHDALTKLHQAIKERTEKLSQKNFMLNESLNYARRIQLSMLPGEREFNQLLGESFVFFCPKDIVSGDFYWAEKKGDLLFFAVADCTGHGVPGAFMSIVGISLLKQIIREPGFESPAAILLELDRRLQNQLDFGLPGDDSREGMDITLCMLNRSKDEMIFSSAGRPVLFVHNYSITEFKGARTYVGKNYLKGEDFTEVTLKLRTNDTVYMLTDGFTDQFDLTDKRKYGITRLKQFLLEIFAVEMPDQLELIKNEFTAWRGSTFQTDDVLIVGFRYRK